MKELFDVKKIALKSGALMSTLSGSGSSFFSLVYEKDATIVLENLKKEFQKFRIEAFDFNNNGYKIIKS